MGGERDAVLYDQKLCERGHSYSSSLSGRSNATASSPASETMRRWSGGATWPDEVAEAREWDATKLSSSPSSSGPKKRSSRQDEDFKTKLQARLVVVQDLAMASPTMAGAADATALSAAAASDEAGIGPSLNRVPDDVLLQVSRTECFIHL